MDACLKTLTKIALQMKTDAYTGCRGAGHIAEHGSDYVG